MTISVGQRVRVPYVPGTIAANVSWGVVKTVIGKYAVVELQVGRAKPVRCQFLISDLGTNNKGKRKRIDPNLRNRNSP